MGIRLTYLEAAQCIRNGSPFVWQPDRPDASGRWFYLCRHGQGWRVEAIYQDGEEQDFADSSYESRDALATHIEAFYAPEPA